MSRPSVPRVASLSAALALFACTPEPSQDTDAATAADAQLPDAGSLSDGSLTDGGDEPVDASSSDGGAIDAAVVRDAFVGDAGPWFTGACEPTGGAEMFTGDSIYCSGTTELAVMAGIGAPHLAILGNVQITGRETSDCIAVDVAQLLAPDGSVVADLGASEGRAGTAAYGEPLLRAAIPTEVSSLCAESERFDRFLVHLEGRVDGGTFSVTCGSTDAPSTFWPPKTMITCHEGLDRAPAGFSVTRMGALLEGRASFPHGPTGAVLTAEGETEIVALPYVLGFSGRMAATRRVGPTLERSTAGERITGTGFPYSEIVTVTVGPTVDLASCGGDTRALRLLRFGGMTARGPYRTETAFGCF